jgi:hypothetical protein
MTRPDPRQDAAAQAPWDVSFLRVGVLVTAGAALVAAPVVGLLVDWPAAVGVVAGAAVVTAFFCLSALVIAWAGRIHDSFTLPAALGSFFVKLVVLFGVLRLVPADGWPDRVALAWTVIAATILWGVVQARWVVTRQQFYVPPPPPPATGADPVEDPESRAPRG